MSEEPSDLATETSDAKPSSFLTFEESRVLGCLLEKEATTPDQYPLTFNSLHSACNQSSNREPVVDFGTDTVEEAMEGLRYKKLSILVHQAGARVPKCKHTLENKYPYLTKGQQAILCVLLLRGPQTVGELRQRTERMHAFADLERVQKVLEEMAAHTPEPIVRLIPAGGGRRVATWMHTLCGDVVPAVSAPAESARGSEAPAASWRTEMEEEIASLKSEVSSLRDELDSIKANLGL
ncbi:MAG: YceH family protein [Verrucomicrobiae bacterium]|nr:YceH family protein [Verrucomicrobiae bacterium]